ncbi:hypothetical protein B0H14DRAFT_2966341 [Mycena olivaceomarginata]|nr:hypothetical protein B0H14DRAFT_2966341 [Mycena olivaceomarginata]
MSHDYTDPSTPPDDAAERAARAADRGRIADIEAQILELERTLSSLYEEKNSLRDRLATYTYPVLTLPNEIVSIFLHFLPNFPEHPPPIAFATPPLWSVISLSLGKVGRLPHKLPFRLLSDLLQTGEPDNGQFKIFGTIFPVSPFFCQHGTSAAFVRGLKLEGRPQKLSQSRHSRFAVVPVNSPQCNFAPGDIHFDDWVPYGTMSRILGFGVDVFTGPTNPVNPRVSLVARSGCNLRELSVLDTNMPRQKYCDAFPVTSDHAQRAVGHHGAFLNVTGWKDGEETESADSEASDSDEE